MRILGLDWGLKRIGVAITDPLGITAQALGVIDTCDWEKRMDLFIQEYEMKEIVLGYPINMDGSIGPRAAFCKEISTKLKERYQLPVILWDERLSTVAAERTLIGLDMRRSKRKKVIDQLAATWILEGYLNSKRRCE